MTHAFNLLKIDSVTKSPQYASVGFQNKTYNQQYFPQGRHYNLIQKIWSTLHVSIFTTNYLEFSITMNHF